jgi:acyl-coenzyme A thioesterase PaaI-like protein
LGFVVTGAPELLTRSSIKNNNMTSNVTAFIKLMKHPVKFRMFLFTKLPSAYFAGVRIRDMNENTCQVTVPYKWFSQNPFRSTYFACLAMAAEMSTGVLALAHLHKRKPTVSMLVVKLEATYFKKAVGRTKFTCEEGGAMRTAIEKAVATGEGESFTATSTGTSETGEVIAKFLITWSFKVKTRTN